MKNVFLWFLALSFSLFQCLDHGLNELDFVTVTIEPPQFVNFNAVQLEGQALNLGSLKSGECGFVWSYERNEVDELLPGAQMIPLALFALDGEGKFKATLIGLDREKTVYFRSYLKVQGDKIGERLVYSEKTETFSVGEIVVNTGQAMVYNDSVVVYGQLRGIKAQMQEVEQHGHVISKIEDYPTVGSASSRSFNAGSSNNDEVFSSQEAARASRACTARTATRRRE